MNELHDQLEGQARLGRELCHRLLGALSSRELRAPIAELRRAHRQLVRSEVSLPRTATAGRFQRRALEELQSQSSALEAQLRDVNARTSEIEARVQQRLAVIEAVLRDAPAPVDSRWGAEGPFYFVFALCLALTGAVLLLGLVGLPLAGSYVVIAFIAPASVRVTFDGRSLRVKRAWFGVRLWTSTYDLTRYNEVVFGAFEVRGENGRSSWQTKLALSSGHDTLTLGVWSAGNPEAAARARELREWCAIAAREKA